MFSMGAADFRRNKTTRRPSQVASREFQVATTGTAACIVFSLNPSLLLPLPKSIAKVHGCESRKRRQAVLLCLQTGHDFFALKRGNAFIVRTLAHKFACDGWPNEVNVNLCVCMCNEFSMAIATWSAMATRALSLCHWISTLGQPMAFVAELLSRDCSRLAGQMLSEAVTDSAVCLKDTSRQNENNKNNFCAQISAQISNRATNWL